jgi:hypothetical protein
MSYADVNHRVTEDTMTVFLAQYPRFVEPILRQAMYWFMDKRLREALGYVVVLKCTL